MRIVDIRERTIDISRYADPAIPSGGLTTSLVAVITDVVRDEAPVVGYGFSSIGRYGQPGLIRERFAPRLRGATAEALLNDNGTNLDPFRAWTVMMAAEKPGGHGERCVAVGTLDMALWDAAAKIAELPLHQFLAGVLDSGTASPQRVPAYAGGGYLYPDDDITRLAEEVQRFLDLGFTHAKIKIGVAGPAQDRRRIEAVTRHLDPARLAVDAMNTYDAAAAMTAATELAPFGLWWFEDVCDPLDFDAQARVAAIYAGPIAAGEALFSAPEAKLLDRYGGLRRDRDVLVFDPVHCYGLPGYLQIIDHLTHQGWPRHAFWPHGGHLFSLHVVATLGLGGAEINPLAFAPFRGLPAGIQIADGFVELPDAPGIGFELHDATRRAFQPLLAT